jgi:ElaB/YqjD/DUF883 family membrane-anchored ribosome-binding protein
MDTKPMSSSGPQAGTSDPTSSAHHTSESFLGSVAEHADEAQRKAAAGVKNVEREIKTAAEKVTHEVKSTARELETEATKVKDEAKRAAGDLVTRAREGAKSAYAGARDMGAHVPDQVASLGRTIDAHVRANPRTDLAIASGASAILGALFGRRIVHLALFAGAAYGLTKLYPQLEKRASSRSRNAEH